MYYLKIKTEKQITNKKSIETYFAKSQTARLKKLCMQ